MNANISITKTDHRDVTRPGHSLTYEITVENTADEDIFDLFVRDELPDHLRIAKIVPEPTLQTENTIEWEGLELATGEKRIFYITATVNEATVNGTELKNVVTADSGDYGLQESAEDITVVE